MTTNANRNSLAFAKRVREQTKVASVLNDQSILIVLYANCGRTLGRQSQGHAIMIVSEIDGQNPQEVASDSVVLLPSEQDKVGSKYVVRDSVRYMPLNPHIRKRPRQVHRHFEQRVAILQVV